MISTVYASLGEKDKAFEYMEKAYEEKSSDLSYFLKSDLSVLSRAPAKDATKRKAQNAADALDAKALTLILDTDHRVVDVIRRLHSRPRLANRASGRVTGKPEIEVLACRDRLVSGLPTYQELGESVREKREN